MSDKDKNKGSAPDGASIDAIETLPLSLIPLNSGTLKNARLIKNSRMETSVELYNDPVSGSLQVPPRSVADNFSVNERDQEIINQLAELHSFDVYSLRGSLKKLGIAVPEGALDLSDGMKGMLSSYAMAFIRPMVEEIFGKGQVTIEAGEGIEKLFRDPDVQKVRENLKVMTDRTGIPLEEIPNFLQTYSDVYLSVAYYRYSFENISAEIDRFLEWIKEVKAHKDVTSSAQTLASCKKVEAAMRFLSFSIRERLASFHTAFENFWKNINRASFDALQNRVTEGHSSMGAVLCGLIVKMRSWSRAFPNNTVGGPVTRAKFVVTELEPGIERLREMENEARHKQGLTPVKA